MTQLTVMFYLPVSVLSKSSNHSAKVVFRRYVNIFTYCICIGTWSLEKIPGESKSKASCPQTLKKWAVKLIQTPGKKSFALNSMHVSPH